MKQSKGYHNGSQEEICLLKRSLYGLKQPGRIWNQKVSEKLKRLGYEPSRTDPCLYIWSDVVHFAVCRQYARGKSGHR